MPKYLTKTFWDKNPTQSLELHETPEKAVMSIEADLTCGAIAVDLYECTPVRYEKAVYTKVILTPVKT